MRTSHFIRRNSPRARKGGARACSVEATGMPRGITRGTPPSRRRPGDDEGIGPHRQAGTFVYSSPELCLPFRTITSLSTEDRGILPHSPGTYKPPQKNTQKYKKCDSGCVRTPVCGNSTRHCCRGPESKVQNHPRAVNCRTSFPL